MRLSYGGQLIELERERREKAYGRETKRFHLKVLICCSALLYVVARCAAWFYPRSVSHTWIDDVLVEVVEDDRLDCVCTTLRFIFLGSLMLLGLLSIKRGVRRNLSKPSRNSRLAASRNNRTNAWSVPFSSIAVPASALLGGLPKMGSKSTSAVGGVPPLRLQQQQQESIRSETELNRFLSLKELTVNKDGEVPSTSGVPAATLPTPSVATNQPPSGGIAFGGTFVGGAIATGPSDGIRVQYRGGADQQTAAQPVDTEWAGLGIVNTERSLLKARKWLSDLCHELAEEMTALDLWFVERQIGSFDTMHCLQETIPLPRSSGGPANVGFAFPSATVSTTPTALRKLDALLNERQKLAGQAQTVQNFDTILHLDQRLALEAKLDPSGTFPSTLPPSVAEQQAQRQYVIKRLRSFASQKTLTSYRHNQGDADLWREGFPTDAHLLIHIVRVCVDGFANYVKFPHQPMNPQQDLALFIGDTGEPYFYVRYRSGPSDKTYATHQGLNSLFEALVIFAGVVRAYHNDSYGGIWGVMDLTRTGLLSVL